MQEKLENKKNTILLFAGLVEPSSNTFWTLESYQTPRYYYTGQCEGFNSYLITGS